MRSYAEIDAELTAPGQFFEVETVAIAAVPTRTWRNAAISLREVLTEGAAVGGEATFIVLGEERLTHREHLRRVTSLAHSLVHELGVGKGDRVAIAMRNYPEWSIAFFAIAMAGAVAVPLNAFWTGPELAFGIEDSGSRVVIADGERLERLAGSLDGSGATLIGTRVDDRPGTGALPPGIRDMAGLLDADVQPPAVDIGPDDWATIFYTSGTTGRPKGVLGTHRNICSNLVGLMYVAARAAHRNDAPPAPTSSPKPNVSLLPVPLFHATGCHSILVSHAFTGGTLVFMRKWDPEVALDLIERERITGMSGVPAMTWQLLSAPTIAERDLSSLRSVGGGGAAAPPELLRRVHELLPGRGASLGYGLTETSSLVSSISGPDYDRHPDSVGVPIPVCEVRIVDPAGEDVPPGERGEVWIKGPTVVPGYWNRPDETAATFTDGWLHSGDVGRVDDEGFLYIVDRAKDIIIRGGENISSAEVEAALFEHPDVLDAAVVALPDPVLGEAVGAVVCTRAGAAVNGAVLRTHLAPRLAAFKIPTRFWISGDALPRNPAGKVLKRDLRERFPDAGT